MSFTTAVTWLVGLGALLVAVKPVGAYLARVFTGQPTLFDRVWGRPERWFFRASGVDPADDMSAVEYAAALVLVNLVLLGGIYVLLRVQASLPFNPQHFSDVRSSIAFNTAASFATNTNWQAYAGERTLSDFSQFAALGFAQFIAPASGIAAAVAFVRALSGRKLGNFFVDVTRACTRVFLPLAVLVALLLVWQGVPETLAGYAQAHLITGGHELIPRGPIASFDAIAHLGQNGGGFTRANSANPLENPTAVSNLIYIITMGILPVGLFGFFGIMTGRMRMAWTLTVVAGVLFLGMLALYYVPQAAGNPIINSLGLHGTANWIGQELRFGTGGSALFTTSSMAFSTGSVVTAQDSLLPLASLGSFFSMFVNMVFGGKGVGVLNMMVFVILTVFLIGLMVGRTPEFLGKKIETREVSLASLAFLVHPFLILGGTALAVYLPAARHGVSSAGAHGLSEILYAFTSAAANNGSAFAGLHAALPFYTLAIAVVMILGRYVPLCAMLLLGESLLRKRTVPETVGTLRTDGVLFGGVLLAAVIIVNALAFFPVIALGPVAEHYLLMAHHLFS